MKKTIIASLLIIVLLFTASCSKTEIINLDVGEESFEKLLVIDSMGTYQKFKSEDEAFDNSDLVIVGMPVNTYADEPAYYYDYSDGKNTLVSEDEKWVENFTVRTIKVLEVLKGEYSEDTLKFAQTGSIEKSENGGEDTIRNLPANEFISKKNAKYIYHLKNGKNEIADFYVLADMGAVNVDGLDTNSLSKISSERLSQIRNKFDDVFDKYDRTKQ